jgi:Ca2+-binding RTX toxin-like protein
MAISGDDRRHTVRLGALLGQDGNDNLYGAGGNDSLTGGAGSDTCDGGTGTDTSATSEPE